MNSKPFKIKDWDAVANRADESISIGSEQQVTFAIAATEQVGKLQQKNKQYK